MANSQKLSTGVGSGAQAATQSPQTSTYTSNLGQTQDIQTGGSPASLLNAQGGIPLHATSSNSVDLANTTSHAAVAAAPSTQHSPNPILLGCAAVFLVIAVILFWQTSISAKNTTQ